MKSKRFLRLKAEREAKIKRREARKREREARLAVRRRTKKGAGQYSLPVEAQGDADGGSDFASDSEGYSSQDDY